MRTDKRILDWFNRRALMKRFRQVLTAQEAEKHLWTEHCNDYRDKDLGYQTIAGQRVKAKRVYETEDLKGPNWIVLDKAFQVSPKQSSIPVYS